MLDRNGDNVKKLNNKGFTLIELLAVLVILIAIMSIALPSINSALERSKDSQNNQKIKMLESAGALYVSEHRNSFDGTCIKLSTLVNAGYIDEDGIKDANGEEFIGYISVIDVENGKFEYVDAINNSCK